MTARYVPIDDFISLVEWLVRQRSEPTRWRFCVFRVGFESPELIGSNFGAQDGLRRLNQFGFTLASSVRRSDVVSRKLSVFWVLSSDCNTDSFSNRLQKLLGSVGDFGLDIVNCSVSAYVFPHPEVGQVSDGWQLLDTFDRLSQARRPETAPN